MRSILNNKCLYLIAILFAITITSCSSDDGESMDQFSVSLATVNPIDTEKDMYHLTLDNGSIIWPSAGSVGYSAKANQRVIINFTPLSGESTGNNKYVRINSLQEILTAQIINLNEDNVESVGNDPIKVLNLWIGDDYLNIRFSINVGGTKTHTINLVQKDGKENELELEFRHNTNGDESRYSIKNYAAFDLRPLQREGQDVIKIIVNAKDYDNTIKTYSIEYNYKK